MDKIGLTGDTRYGQTPGAGLQTFTYSWDTTTFTPNAGRWRIQFVLGQCHRRWGQVFFGDETRNDSDFNLAITKVTLSGADIVAIPEPASVSLLGLGIGAFLVRRRKR